MEIKTDICVIGAGPAGIAAAIAASTENIGTFEEGNRRREVLLVDSNAEIGKKLLMTGNGRCNFAHDGLEEDAYRGSFKDVGALLYERMGSDFVLDFMRNIGVFSRNIKGYYYPASNQAVSVVRALDYAVFKQGIKTLLNSKVIKAKKDEAGEFIITALTLSNNKKNKKMVSEEAVIKAKRVIFACGGKAAANSGSDGSINSVILGLSEGIKFNKQLPALCGLILDEANSDLIKGARAFARVSLFGIKEDAEKELLSSDSGEIVFTENVISGERKCSVSGLPVMSVSRFASEALFNALKKEEGKPFYKELELKVDFAEDLSEKDILIHLLTHVGDKLSIALCGIVNDKIAELIELKGGIKGKINEENAVIAASLIKNMTFKVINTRGYEDSQVTTGGIDLSETDTDSFELKKIKGAYAAGELLDLDGKCGGYNITFALESGFIAGSAAEASLHDN